MQIWNMKMKMGVIKVIYEAPQSHLWRRHDSLVSFMCGRPSLSWQASLPGAAVSLQGRTKVTYRLARPLCLWFILLIKMCDRSLCISLLKDTIVCSLFNIIPIRPIEILHLPFCRFYFRFFFFIFDFHFKILIKNYVMLFSETTKRQIKCNSNILLLWWQERNNC